METDAAEQSPGEPGEEDSSEVATCYWSAVPEVFLWLGHCACSHLKKKINSVDWSLSDKSGISAHKLISTLKKRKKGAGTKWTLKILAGEERVAHTHCDKGTKW